MTDPTSDSKEIDGARYVRACRLEELPPGEAIRVEGRAEPIAVFNDEGDLFAIADRCTHQEASLSDGWLEDGEVECPLHASRFDIRTGKVRGQPATEDEPTFRVVEEGGEIFVGDLPDTSASEGGP